MKMKRQIEVAICDFCENDAWKECQICGKDVCQNHDLTLHVNFRGQGEGYSVLDWDKFIHSTQLVRHFCPEHLTDELNKMLVQSLVANPEAS